MSSSTLLRRGIFHANRMMTTRCGGESPWVMIRANNKAEDGTVFRFWCCAKKTNYSFFRNGYKREQEVFDFDDAIDGTLRVVGSSQGWLALRDIHSFFLLDPIRHRCIDLPPPPFENENNRIVVQSIVLSPLLASEKGDEGGKAFMVFGVGQWLAFCSPKSHGCEWATFGDVGTGYDSVVYSTTHRRLLCISSTCKLEGWDVRGDSSPSLDIDWVAQLKFDPPAPLPAMHLKYLVCAEEDLLLVVRIFENNCFMVYRVDLERRRLMKMDKSLEELTIFVGNNDAITIKDVAGVKPDSIYFTSDHRMSGYNPLGIFDYKKCFISPLLPNHYAYYPAWFTYK
ncbi:hypothetical protein OROGR_033094 [Orobanche gracilis]